MIDIIFKLLFFFAGESISVDAVKNALKLFQHWDYLDCYAEDKIRLLYLKNAHDNQDSIDTLFNKINQYRVST